ncbi:MAG: hypothetical protein H0W46_11630, partial [Acidimicrobiia bacterium]|nr:hypothetical protein [Acidimicrobiia bacterium]
EAIAEDEQLRGYVRMLEIEYDRRVEASVTSGDDLAARFEAFLRERDRIGDGEGDGNGGPDAPKEPHGGF